MRKFLALRSYGQRAVFASLRPRYFIYCMKRHNEQYNTGVAYYSTGPPVPEIMYFTALAAGGSSNPTPVALTLTPADGRVRHTTGAGVIYYTGTTQHKRNTQDN